MDTENIFHEIEQIVEELEVEESDSELLPTQLPLSKIKKMAKLVPSLQMITSEAVRAITYTAEVYVELLTKAAFQLAQEDGRKTLQLKDINRTIKRDWLFAILEDGIDDWPEFMAKAKPGATNPVIAVSIPEIGNEAGEEHLDDDEAVQKTPDESVQHLERVSFLDETTEEVMLNSNPTDVPEFDNASEGRASSMRDIEDM